ncbi:hypothetical protein IWW57_004894 [Coemansia sp. S610]|uniref:Uncharacterized protein n=1 Tax=Coemansia linderi TaxID=2663919 RepID=A0ACC1KN98_9FUNG|nr:hypothetical protein LPJ60_003843 [Coemansia sp. RSA 2675]KAJ2021540.1 hypothetical protein IWW57_004894 [Coemansia sp. S610]KAJ2400563.1 hypothetical protein GGI10_006202 [Coemansia sp. RSA 2530]KAJ2792322.1 hypothetical protein GGI18_000496 [Coemansia linderi]
MPVTLLHSLPALSQTRFTAEKTRVACDPPSDAAHGLGTLYIDEQRVVFFSTEASCGFSIDYPTIVIHAVSRSADPVGAHLYCQLDGPFPGYAKAGGDSDEEDEEEQFAELRFIPEDEQLLDDMFKAMSDCAALNPDDGGSDSGSDLDDLCVGDYQDESASRGEEDSGEDESAVQTIEEFDSSAFITSPDQLSSLTPKGRETLAHLESIIVESTEQTNGYSDEGRFDDAE